MAPHAENEHVAVDEKTTNGNKNQTQGKGQSKGKGRGKGKGDTQNKERIQRLDQIYSKKKRQTYFVPTPISRVEPEKHGQAAHVVLKVRRIIDDTGYPSNTEIDIKSTLLKDALLDIFEGVEGLTLNESPPMVSQAHSTFPFNSEARR